ncbi:unnamed protein product [Calicophoron daubneyi]|uniref:Uncharacterized protein n=1 Tax=Calicophoron daubneyi TaxID=300641 RepID=A0AAV2T7X5_CALDB
MAVEHYRRALSKALGTSRSSLTTPSSGPLSCLQHVLSILGSGTLKLNQRASRLPLVRTAVEHHSELQSANALSCTGTSDLKYPEYLVFKKGPGKGMPLMPDRACLRKKSPKEMNIPDVNQPIFATFIADKVQQLLCGTADGIISFEVDLHRVSGRFVSRKRHTTLDGHRDIVTCITQAENRLFSAGFDRRLVVYDISGSAEPKAAVSNVVREAHNGIISYLATGQNNSRQTVVISGSYDRLVKVWNEEGQLLNIIRGFSHPIVGIAYVPLTNTFWVSSLDTPIKVIDMETAIEVTDICGSFSDKNCCLQYGCRLKFCPDISVLVVCSPRGYLMTWRNNTRSSVAVMQAEAGILCLTQDKLAPQNFFSNGTDNRLFKWERKGTTHFTYVHEEVLIKDSMEDCLQRTVDLKVRNFPVKAKHLDALRTLFPPTLFVKPLYPLTAVSSLSSADKNQCEQLIAACEDGVIYVFGYDYKETKSFLMSTSNEVSAKNEDKKDAQEDAEMQLLDINHLWNAPNLRKVINKLKQLEGCTLGEECTEIDSGEDNEQTTTATEFMSPHPINQPEDKAEFLFFIFICSVVYM